MLGMKRRKRANETVKRMAENPEKDMGCDEIRE